MEVHVDKTSLNLVGIERQGSFNVELTAQVYDMLSRNLYKNPILAVVRELSCNAYDSHVMANKKDTPFTVKLPNQLDPTDVIS